MRSVAKQVVRRRRRRGKVPKTSKKSKMDWASILILLGVVLVIIAFIIVGAVLGNISVGPEHRH